MTFASKMSSHLTLPAYWLVRLYFSLSVVVTALVVGFVSVVPAYGIVAKSGPAGQWLLLALACLGAVGVLDVLVNDLLPAGYTLKNPKIFRHFIYIAMSIGLVGLSYVIIKNSSNSMLVLRLLLDASVGGAVSVLDLLYRHRQE